MKVTINIDCTPEEARTFFGLPDVKPIQEAMMGEVQERMKQGMSTMDMDSLMKTWMPAGMQGLENFQKMFWGAVSKQAGAGATAASGATGKDKKD